jgi:bleomycin hydrolase
MKKSFPVFLLFLCAALLLFTGCSGKSGNDLQVVEKQMIQLGDQDLRQMEDLIYKTRERRGREYSYAATDLSHIEKPASVEEFTQVFHQPPIRQDMTGTCWCFSTTSLLEAEVKRLGRGEVKLSEMFTVYWEFYEKAMGFIRKKGDQRFTSGSEHNAVFLRMKQYGSVPAEAYSGLLGDATEHNHGPLTRELRNYLDYCKANEYWDEGAASAAVSGILDKHLGKAPAEITVDGQTMTPKEYLDNVLGLNMDDYVSFMSFEYAPFYTQGVFKVNDNWWDSDVYYNVPLDEFYAALVGALKNGYSVALGGDTSEPGLSGEFDIGIVASFDIHPKMIDQNSREFRFTNRTSTDDHAIHAVGMKDMGDHTWFLIKDSGGGAQRGEHKGYYFYRDDYIKLKMMVLTMHKDAAADLLSKFPQE